MSDVEELRALCEAKALAELGDADAVAGVGPGSWTGDVMAGIAAVVGTPCALSDALLPDPAGEALSKALPALGFGDGPGFLITSRPTVTADDEALAHRLRLALEAVDPSVVMALDAVAARDLGAAFRVEDLPAGVPVAVAGRVLGYAGEFAVSLRDDAAKARVWKAMKMIVRGDADAPGTPARRRSTPRKGSDARAEER